MKEFLKLLSKERPVGTKENAQLLEMIETYLRDMGYFIQSIPFDCMVWNRRNSAISTNTHSIAIEPSPFSEPFRGSGTLHIVKTLEELEAINCKDEILVLAGDLTKEALQPKDYPFYYPDEHRILLTLLETKSPKALLCVTGKNTLNGQNPFPLFEDGNFLIPSGNIGKEYLDELNELSHLDVSVHIEINSYKTKAKSRQLIASKKVKNAKGKIIIGAHMDSKYNTPGALDNATGVAVLMQIASMLNSSIYDIDLVPFNSEEYYGANGELEYLGLLENDPNKVLLMINIDSVCHKGSKTAVSFYNFSNSTTKLVETLITRSPQIVKGNEWYAGDHVPFVFRNIPCMAITSSDFFDGALEHTHTPNDTLDTIDIELIKPTAQYILDVIDSFAH